MTAQLDQLVDSLLYEGYALYPYTPGATKNATPTPFGILYPPAYAAGNAATYDHLRVVCLCEPGPGARLQAELRFLAPTGERHRASAQRLTCGPLVIGGAPLAGEHVRGGLRVGLRLTAEPQADGRVRVTLEARNLTAARSGLDRAGALRQSLISTHPVLRVSAGRFVSPLEAGCASVNTFPVLATPGDDVIVGAAIVLPDHPQLAPESLGNLFDSTEIEEALLLHVRALSDGERAAIEGQDPAVRAMVERAAATTPEELLALHGRVTVRDPVTREPPRPSAEVRDPSAGEERAEAEGKTFTRGGRVRLRPGPGADLHARLLDGHTATVERIFVDYDGRVHLGVTVDDVPGQDLLRETGRLLFFFPGEVEVIA